MLRSGLLERFPPFGSRTEATEETRVGSNPLGGAIKVGWRWDLVDLGLPQRTNAGKRGKGEKRMERVKRTQRRHERATNGATDQNSKSGKVAKAYGKKIAAFKSFTACSEIRNKQIKKSKMIISEIVSKSQYSTKFISTGNRIVKGLQHRPV